MKRLTFLPLLVALITGTSVSASSVIYRGEDQLGPLGKTLSVFEDPSGNMSAEDVVRNGAFVISADDIPNFGTSGSAFWLMTEVYNASPSDRVVLNIDYPEIDELDLYLFTNGKLVSLVRGGQLRPRAARAQDSPAFSFNLPIAYGAYGTLYIKTKSSKLLQVPIFLQNEETAVRHKLSRNIFMGGYIGIMLVMVLYNLFVFISTRDRSYLFYVMYLLAVGLTQLSFTGYAAFYIWPGSAWIIKHSSTTFTVITMILATEFMQRFINVTNYDDKFLRIKSSIYVIAVFGAISSMLGASVLGYTLIQTTSSIMATYILFIAVKITRAGHRPARYFLAAWSVFMTGVLVFVAKDWGLLPYNDITKYMMIIGSAVEVVLLSFGLADKINVLRREKELSQAEALRMAKENERFIRDQNVVLEQKVTERTHALQESNDHLKRTQSQLVSAEKMASLGQLTAGIAHEINNPLNFISSNIPPLKRDLLDLKEVLDAYRSASKDDPAMKDVHALEERIGVDYTVKEVHEILACMETGAARTSEIVRGLRTFSRLDEDDLKEADINEGLRSTVVVLGPQFRDAVEVKYDLADLPELECYPGKLNQLFMNLLNNAAHAVKQRHGTSGGVVSITTRLDGDRIRIDIMDNGMGMDESIQARLFEPFFTTKDVGEGTGLGLSIAQGIVEKHQGHIAVKSVVGQGTTFTITLPTTRSGDYAKSA
ncbi:MAG: sensor histidine kinase [Flavobacteriales bacterium]|nr:sensor histidine kinase [Flavobacteriales bacterium]